MATAFLVLTFFFAVLDWVSVYNPQKPIKPLEYAAKPATTICLLAYFLLAKGEAAPLFWFGLGLALSIAGDIFLLLPREQLMPGLVSFLLAHICYIIGFNMPLPPLTAWGLLFAVTYALMAARIFRKINAGLASKGLLRLKIPVLAYTVVITIMLLSATLTLYHPNWQAWPSALVFLGAALFFLSDVNQAFYRFVGPIKRGRVITMVAYHLGQIGIIVGAVLQFQ
jgi:uncharacterized membrane protein YhhN